MRRFNIPGRKRSHIVRTDSYYHQSDTGIISLCGQLYPTLTLKPLRADSIPCQSCLKLSKPGVNC